MRTTKELLIILRDNLVHYMDRHKCPNMYAVIGELLEDSIINCPEADIIERYIDLNKPRYNWVPSKIWVRYRWLNKQIEKL
jgi:hypothetical protein